VGGTGATHNDGEDIYLGTRLVESEGVGKRGVFISDKLRGVMEVIVCAILPFPYFDLFNRGVATSGIRVADEHGFEESDEVEHVSEGSERGG
jgi:hypothetical protein